MPPTRAMVLPLFTLTIFVSAVLLFWVQPLFGKMVLPLLGGAPTVWNTAMLFFQTTLLAGYAYAHLVGCLAGTRAAVALHLAVLAVGALALPVAVAEIGQGDMPPVLWLIALLAASVGAPIFAVSATAPLIQKWFAGTGHPHAGDPYFLYGASNLGSILILLGYPVVAEPLLRLHQQSGIWAVGYALLAVLITLCGVLGVRRNGWKTLTVAEGPAVRPVTWRQRAVWMMLSFAPSSLLLGVTAQITTDVAAVPLLWVLPLVIYLLTFVLVFARRPLLKQSWMVRAQPFVLVWSFLLLAESIRYFWVVLAAYLVLFFVTSMVCHGELVRRRPEARHLTDFYLCMAFGGMLGGVFNALLAPVLFSGIHEFFIALVAACLLRPGVRGGGRIAIGLDWLIPLLVLGAMVLPWAAGFNPRSFGRFGYLAYVAAFFLVGFAFKERSVRYGLGVGAVLLAITLFGGRENLLAQDRSFFGLYRVTSSNDGAYRLLRNGTTVHGAQAVGLAARCEPLTYYTRAGPLGQLFDALARNGAYPKRVGLVGLGIGTALTYQRPGFEAWKIYEIDPLVNSIAMDTRYFHFMTGCGNPDGARLVYGDARLSLASEPDGRFGLLVLDAFSSDAIPVHLLTREAMALYRRKLGPGGILMIHISNRHLDLAPVVAALARDANMAAMVQRHGVKRDNRNHYYPSVWVAQARKRPDLDVLAADPRWETMKAPAGAAVWTDDFSNILSVLR